MKSKKLPCALCGKKQAPWIIERKGKKIALCNDCKEAATAVIHGDNEPVMWAGKVDIEERCDNDLELLKEARALTRCDIVSIADRLSGWFWDQDANGSWFSDSIMEAFLTHLSEKEAKKINDTPVKDLPLLIGTIKHKENEELLEKRMRSGK